MSASFTNDPRQQEKDSIAKAIRALYGAYKSIRLYTPTHPASLDACQKFIVTLSEVFTLRFDFPLQHLDGLFLVEDFLFIEESLSLYDLLRGMENHAVSKITFLSGATATDVTALCSFLMSPGAAEGMTDHNFSNERITILFHNNESKDGQAGEPVTTAFTGDINAVYDDLLNVIDQTFTRTVEEQTVAVSELALPLDRLIDAVHRRPDDFALLICGRPITKLNQQHALNTTIQSIFIGQQLGFDPTSLKTLALASVLHDVGRLLLPSDYTTGYRLAPGDVDIIHLHTRDGAALLSGAQGLPINVIRAALEHHIGYDGIGYPSLSTPLKPHIFSQIIGLADFISWRTVSENHYHKPVAPHRIIRAALHRAGTQFSPLLVKLLVPFFGLYPPGTAVRLSSGETAVAMAPNLKHVARPTVLTPKADNTWTPRLLAELSGNTEQPFTRSVDRVTGVHNDTASLAPFLTTHAHVAR